MTRSPLISSPRGLCRAVAAVAAALVLAAGCGRGGEEEPPDPLPADDTATAEQDQVAMQSDSTDTMWRCGTVKQHVYAIVNDLAEPEQAAAAAIDAIVAERVHADAAARAAAAAATADEQDQQPLAAAAEQLADAADAAGDAAAAVLDRYNASDSGDSDEGDSDEGGGIVAAVDAARSGFSAADETALNAACQLYGQHEAALELWNDGNLGDACDVWIPAAEAAQSASRVVVIDDIHPMVSRFWVGATGSVAEGWGRCIAERAN